MPRAPRVAEYVLEYVSQLLGEKLAVDIDADMTLTYQKERLREGASSK
jgi:hypothetical protein